MGRERMTRDEIELLRAARPTVSGPSVELAERAKGELMTEISGTQRRRRTTRRRRAIAVSVVAPIAAAVALASTLIGAGGETAWASAVEVARAAPRLLVTDPGWTVARADEFIAEYGEMTFVRDTQQLEITWGPGQDHKVGVEKRAAELEALPTVLVAGDSAHVFRYPGTNEFSAFWLRGEWSVEARGLAPNAEVFAATLASLQKVDVDTWLAAMPDNVVKPASRADVVGEMLASVPQPDGFDAVALRNGDEIRDRYQLGAQVAGAVACAWIGQWVDARRVGDESGAQQAVTAMATSHRWPILLEMNEEGDYPEVLWDLADAMATDGVVMGGKPLTIEASYADALGCGS
jgi:hypothetical protein